MTEMTPERWRRIRPLLDELLDLEEGERTGRLNEIGEADEGLAMDLRRLIEAYQAPPSVLKDPFGGTSEEDVLSDSRLGSEVGGYRILERIGQGGMATVYLAERSDGAFDHRVALKVIRPGMATEAMRRRFREERQILASFNHPNIARLYDGGLTKDGVPYIVMEWVEGSNLGEHCDRERLKVEDRLALFETVCEAVDYAHRNLVVHRDLKPSNILVTENGEVKLLDFGVAKLIESEGEESETGTLTALHGSPLTPAYAAPEQVAGEAITTAADVYALGMVLYELLVGVRPTSPLPSSNLGIASGMATSGVQYPSTAVRKMDRDSELDEEAPSVELIAASRGTNPERLASRLKGDLDNIVLMALRPEPERRYPSARLLREDLERHRRLRPVRARPESWSYGWGRFLRRNRLVVGLATAVVLALVLGLGLAIRGHRAARQEALTSARVSEFLVELFRGSDPTYGRNDSTSARDLLDEAAARIDFELSGEPEIRAKLLLVIGESYGGLGVYDRAVDLVENGLDLMKEIGRPRKERLWARASRAALLRNGGRLEEAESAFEGLMKDVAKGDLGGELEATILNDYGMLSREKGDLPGAESLYRKALEIRSLEGTLRTQEGARTLNNLAMALSQQKVLEEAEVKFHEVLRIQREVLVEPHGDIARTLNNLASVLRRRGDLAQAETMALSALKQRRELLGENHPDVAQSLNNLGTLRYYREDYEGAVVYLEEALRVWNQVFDGDHPRLADVLSNIGSIQRKQKKLESALDFLSRSAEMQERLRGDQHPQLALALYRWGDCLLEGGYAYEAKKRLERALEIQRVTLGEGHERTVKTTLALTQARRALGMKDEVLANSRSTKTNS